MSEKKLEVPKIVDKDLEKGDEVESGDDIFIDQLCEGLETYKKDPRSTFLGALMAGLEIGFSFLVVAVCYSFFIDKIDKDTVPYLAAFVYPLGFVLVILGKSILFTEQTSLLSLPVLSGRRSVGELLRLWGLVISGNLLGGYIIGFIFILVGPSLGVVSEKGMIALAHHVAHYDYIVIFGSAIIAGWLMALLSWILSSIKETIGQIAVIYIITFIIGLSGLHHSIVGNIEVFTGLILSPDISFLTYLTFIVLALFGNAMGGVVFVGILKYGAFITNKKII
ncbi:formate/nitrite transporter family protein [Maribacter aestuarii]|uniref:formate/nitrite transporter family protein n=1 Tax=Maribacter aestuarii TaxID=1130723 RepID=UPI00248B6E48|nr:formate/nitrite transporter family protein [Maribacter aestuarii]